MPSGATPLRGGLESDELFASAAQREAQARIRHLLDTRGIGLLTGEAGCGKTTVCRQATDSLHKGQYQVSYVALTTGSVLDLYNLIAAELGLPATTTRHAAYRAIRTEISRRVAESRLLPVLVIDEAHHLRNELLEELRLLTNFRMDSDNRLCLLLVGLTELRRRIAMSVHESLAQRIVVNCHLASLEREEISAYIQHRLGLAGAEIQIFEANAVEAIAQLTQGVPRRINALAHHALHAATLSGTRSVTIEHVQSASEDLAL